MSHEQNAGENITNKSFKNRAESIYLGLIQIKSACMEKIKSRFLISANIFLPCEPGTFAFHLLCKIIKNRKYNQP
jgi:hypothetical protein